MYKHHARAVSELRLKRALKVGGAKAALREVCRPPAVFNGIPAIRSGMVAGGILNDAEMEQGHWIWQQRLQSWLSLHGYLDWLGTTVQHQTCQARFMRR
eukprot:1645404-Amphidinium_carterae.1